MVRGPTYFIMTTPQYGGLGFAEGASSSHQNRGKEGVRDRRVELSALNRHLCPQTRRVEKVHALRKSQSTVRAWKRCGVLARWAHAIFWGICLEGGALAQNFDFHAARPFPNMNPASLSVPEIFSLHSISHLPGW